MSYLGLTIVVVPLNIVQMSVSICRQANLCHRINTHQIIVAFSIDDGVNVAIFDDEENLE
jgi:mevalonate pyrophosphate decarboxylase